MRVLVCGGRDYGNRDRVFEVLSSLDPFPTFVIEGGADGADAWAWQWAKRNLPADCRMQVNADWSRYGRGAGHIRNQQMLDEGKPDVVIAFPGGKGTADMVKRARFAGVEVIEVIEVK